MSVWKRAASILALSALAIPAVALDTAKQITIEAVKVSTAPKLDGMLDDKCWQGLPEYTNFTDGDTRQLHKCQTSAWVCYDDNYLYIAFHALHPNPSRLKAQETKRNGGGFRRDDFVAVNIDSQHTHRSQSWFDVNPLGTQAENLQRSASSNIQYKGDWSAAAKIVDDGYNVEMAIPFSLLVYDDRQDTFGISFRRNLADDNVWSVWPDLNGTNDLIYYANLTGLDLPPTELRPKILTYILGTSGNNAERNNYQGMDIKYPFSSSSVGVLSVNPDFNTIEQQVESIDFSYTERYLEDARPFFNEWNVPVSDHVFYSRRIEDFDTGLKFAGASGPNSYGLMSMRSFGDQSDSVMSYSRNVGNMSMLRFDMSDHRTPGHRNVVSYAAGVLKWTRGQRTNTLNSGLFGSTTTNRPNGRVWYTDFDSVGAPGDLNFYYSHAAAEDEFNNEIGYISDRGLRGGYWGLWRETALRGTNLQSVYTALNFFSRDKMNGEHWRSSVSPSVTFSYVDGHEISLTYLRQKYLQFREEVPQLSVSWNNNAMYRDGAMGVSWGRKVGGDYLLSWARQKFRLGRRMVLGVDWNREYIGDTSPYSGTRRQAIFTLNYDLNSERSLGGRLVAQQGERNAFFMYRQQVRHGTDAYLIYGDPNAQTTDSRMTFKLMRTL